MISNVTNRAWDDSMDVESLEEKAVETGTYSVLMVKS